MNPIVLYFLVSAILVQCSLGTSCPNYRPSDFNNPSCEGQETLYPINGPLVGGAVLEIDDLSYCTPNHPKKVRFYCRFESSSHLDIVLASRRFSKILCPTPYWGQVEDVTVSYTAVMLNPPSCAFDSEGASWNELEQKYRYGGYDVSVSVDGTSTSSLIFVNQSVDVKWSADSLLLSVDRYAVINPSVAVEVLALNSGTNASPSFKKIISMIMPSNTIESFTLTIPPSITPHLNNEWGIEGGPGAGVILVRVIAYLPTPSGKKRIFAAKSSDLIGVLPNNNPIGNSVIGECPMIPKEECDYDSATEVCPPTYLIAENDGNFRHDKLCEWPTGDNDCDSTFSITEEWYLNCKTKANENTPSWISPHCSSIDYDSSLVGGDGCACNLFREGAKGCMRSGSTQCCYSKSGALITEVSDGGGTISCSPSNEERPYESPFLYDTLPFLYCCVANDSCDDYYEKLAPVAASDDGTSYNFPDLGLAVFGDPHLETFDQVHYDFNGAGEYVLFCGTTESSENLLGTDSKCDPSALPQSDMLSIHCQFELLDADDGGTVMTALAVKHPDFESGSEYIVITSDLKAYAGSSEVSFPEKTRGLTEYALVGDDIKIKRTADLTKDRIVFRLFTPELNLKVAVEEGVLTPTLIEDSDIDIISVGLSGFVGDIVGDDDDDDAAVRKRHLRAEEINDKRRLSDTDFFTSNGTTTNIEYEINDDSDKVVVDETIIENIFDPFGVSWEITDEDSSLFGVLNNFEEINIDFDPRDESTRRRLITEEDAIEKCELITADAVVKKSIITEACIYDMLATNNEHLVTSMTEVAKAEFLELETLINNQPPHIDGNRNPIISVNTNKEAFFTIQTSDVDGQTVSAAFERNDNKLFVLSSQSEFIFNLKFIGSHEVGKFKAQVIISDGLANVLFTATVDVTD